MEKERGREGRGDRIRIQMTHQKRGPCTTNTSASTLFTSSLPYSLSLSSHATRPPSLLLILPHTNTYPYKVVVNILLSCAEHEHLIAGRVVHISCEVHNDGLAEQHSGRDLQCDSRGCKEKKKEERKEKKRREEKRKDIKISYHLETPSRLSSLFISFIVHSSSLSSSLPLPPSLSPYTYT